MQHSPASLLHPPPQHRSSIRPLILESTSRTDLGLTGCHPRRLRSRATGGVAGVATG